MDLIKVKVKWHKTSLSLRHDLITSHIVREFWNIHVEGTIFNLLGDKIVETIMTFRPLA